jgi:hypothetical protein
VTSSPTIGKTSITAACSYEFKERVQEYMARHGKTQTDVIIEAVSDLLKFDSFVEATEHTSAADDWALMARDLGHEGRR